MPEKTDLSQCPPMTIAECKVETMEHIEEVRKNLRWFSDKLQSRGVCHDRSKLESPEVESFAEHNSRLKYLEYGTEEYSRELAELKPALDHHYAKNRHHPEHFDHGINDMNLVDLVEMICDWMASAKRNKNGNILKTLEHNADRFHIDHQLLQILLNTVKAIEESE